MIITTHPADYIVDVGRETHLTCAHHAGGIIQLARIACVPVSIIELDTDHMFECEVCDLLNLTPQSCL
jgi:hypothetical protein